MIFDDVAGHSIVSPGENLLELKDIPDDRILLYLIVKYSVTITNSHATNDASQNFPNGYLQEYAKKVYLRTNYGTLISVAPWKLMRIARERLGYPDMRQSSSGLTIPASGSRSEEVYFLIPFAGLNKVDKTVYDFAFEPLVFDSFEIVFDMNDPTSLWSGGTLSASGERFDAIGVFIEKNKADFIPFLRKIIERDIAITTGDINVKLGKGRLLALYHSGPTFSRISLQVNGKSVLNSVVPGEYARALAPFRFDPGETPSYDTDVIITRPEEEISSVPFGEWELQGLVSSGSSLNIVTLQAIAPSDFKVYAEKAAKNIAEKRKGKVRQLKVTPYKAQIDETKARDEIPVPVKVLHIE
jgi:hypothetical protein